MNLRAVVIALGLALTVALGALMALRGAGLESGSEVTVDSGEPEGLEELAAEVRNLKTSLQEAELRIAGLEASLAGSDSDRPSPGNTRGRPISAPSPAEETSDSPGGAGDSVGPGTESSSVVRGEGASSKVDLAGSSIVDLAYMARVGNKEAFNAILGRLADKDPRIREDATKALAYVIKKLRSGGESVDPGLIDRVSPLVNDPHFKVREEVAKCLKVFKAPDASSHLVKLLSDASSDVVCEALDSLRELDCRNTLSHVSRLSQGQNLEVATKAGIALRAWGDDAGADAVLSRLSVGLTNPDAGERRRAVDRVRKIGGWAGHALLKQAAGDPDPEVSARAAKALLKLEKKLKEEAGGTGEGK